jgi:hypothetical protein
MAFPIGGFQQTMPNAGFGLGGPSLGGFSNPGAAGPLGPLGDRSNLSLDALNGASPLGDMNPLLQGLTDNLGQQQPPNPVQQLQEAIEDTQMELQEAQVEGNPQKIQSLQQKLQMLQAQLAQLTGQGQQPGGGDPGAAGGGDGGGAAPAGAAGGGAPGGGGGMPSFGGPGGGSPGGGAPGGGSPGGGAPSIGGGPGGRTRGSDGPSGQHVGPNVDTSNVKISGDGQGVDAVNWANSQEGVSESKNPGTVRGYSKGAWQSWCADFVSTAYEKTGGSPWGHQSSVQGIMDWGKKNPGHWLSADAARKDPSLLKVGDAVIWKQNGKSHTGLLTGVNKDGTYTTIEGNTSDKVAKRTHRFNNNQLTGFVRGRGTFGEKSSTSSTRSSSSSSSSSTSSTKSTTTSKPSTSSTSSTKKAS